MSKRKCKSCGVEIEPYSKHNCGPPEQSRAELRARIAELEAEVERLTEWRDTLRATGQHLIEENERLRGLLAEMLALNPIVSGDMEKVRVWASTLAAVRAALTETTETKEEADD